MLNVLLCYPSVATMAAKFFASFSKTFRTLMKSINSLRIFFIYFFYLYSHLAFVRDWSWIHYTHCLCDKAGLSCMMPAALRNSCLWWAWNGQCSLSIKYMLRCKLSVPFWWKTAPCSSYLYITKAEICIFFGLTSVLWNRLHDKIWVFTRTKGRTQMFYYIKVFGYLSALVKCPSLSPTIVLLVTHLVCFHLVTLTVGLCQV